MKCALSQKCVPPRHEIEEWERNLTKIPSPKLECIIYGQSQIPQISLHSRVPQKSKSSHQRERERAHAFGDLRLRDNDRQLEREVRKKVVIVLWLLVQKQFGLCVKSHSLPAVEDEAGAGSAMAVEGESPTCVGLETVFASLCWLTTEGWRRSAPGTAVWLVWNV